jgi:hypothetical protein
MLMQIKSSGSYIQIQSSRAAIVPAQPAALPRSKQKQQGLKANP